MAPVVHHRGNTIPDRTLSAMRAACFALCLTLCACINIPAVEGTVAPDLENAAYPKLVPLDPLMAQAVPTGVDPELETRNLESRIAALRARARALQNR